MKAQLLLLYLLVVTSVDGQTTRAAFHNANNIISVVAPVGVKRWIYIDFAKTDLNAGAKWNDVFGTPNLAIVAVADLLDTAGASTGIGFTTIATANWNAYGGNTSVDMYNVSMDGTYYPTATTAAMWQSVWWNYGSAQPGRYDVTKPQMKLTGLNPASTYTVYMTTEELCCGGGFTDKGVFRIVGLTSPTAIEVDGDLAVQPGGATFTLQPTAGGELSIWVNTSTTNLGDLVVIPMLMIKEL
jgi:hypothetical protein